VSSVSGLDSAVSSARGVSALIELPGSPAAIAGISAVDEIIGALQ
jgi:hypothetical protein